MSTGLLERKLTKRFALFDADADGLIGRSDIAAAARSLLEAFGEPPDSPQGRDVITAYASLWNGLVQHVDRDGDGLVSLHEFIAFFTGPHFATDGYDATCGRIAESVLALADNDGDHVISYAEFSAIPGIAALPDHERRQVFDRLDTDHSGTIDITELHDAQREFYTSHSPDAPGNQLFGTF